MKPRRSDLYPKLSEWLAPPETADTGSKAQELCALDSVSVCTLATTYVITSSLRFNDNESPSPYLRNIGCDYRLPWSRRARGMLRVKNLDHQCRARVLPARNTFLMCVALSLLHVPSGDSSCTPLHDSRVKWVSILMPLIVLAHGSTSWPHTYSAITRGRLLSEGRCA